MWDNMYGCGFGCVLGGLCMWDNMCGCGFGCVLGRGLWVLVWVCVCIGWVMHVG